MSRLLLITLALLALQACEDEEPLPGEIVGLFEFVAFLDTSPFEGRCSFTGSPGELRFEGVLSYTNDEATGDPANVLLQIDGVSRAGTIDGIRFTTTSSDGTGESSVPRRISSCDCTMDFVEVIEGDLLPAVPQDGCPPALDPELATDRFDPRAVGGICGWMRELVEVPSGCTCTSGDTTLHLAGSCEIRYRIAGRRG